MNHRPISQLRDVLLLEAAPLDASDAALRQLLEDLAGEIDDWIAAVDIKFQRRAVQLAAQDLRDALRG